MLNRFFVFKRSSLAVFAFVWGLCFTAQPAAFAGGQVPFKASYQLDVGIVFDLPLAIVTSTGAGLATHLGVFSARSIEEVVNLATGVGDAVHEFTAANGDKLVMDFHLQATPSPTGFTITGVWEITGGTGRFEGASGEGTYAGAADFTSPITAVATFEMVGTISSPGSLK
jgi:hypothetical protein